MDRTRDSSMTTEDNSAALIAVMILLVVVGLPAMTVAYFFAQNMGWPGIYGPAGITSGVGSLAVLWACSKVSARNAHQRAIDRAERERAEEWSAWLAQFRPELRDVMYRLAEPTRACAFWSELGLGTWPDHEKGIPSAWPELTPQDGDPGAWNTGIGVRIRLSMLDNQEPKMFEEKRFKISTALNLPAVSVPSSLGRTIELDLKVYDPLRETNVSQLLDPATGDRIRAALRPDMTPAEEVRAMKAASAGAQLMVPVDSISCTDDIPLLLSEHGDWVTVNLASGAHGAVQGASRSGKSIFLNSLLAWASLMRDVRVVIIDPNSALVAPWWRTAYLVCNSDDPAEATAVLRQVNREMKEREHLFWEARTDRITDFSEELPLYLVVIDEIPEFAENKDFQVEAKRFGAQSAKFGGRFFPAGQKLDEKSLSTATRANLFARWCFRVESRHDMTHLFENAPDLMAKGLTAVGSMPKGVAIVRTPSHPEECRARSVYLPTEACWTISDAIVAKRGQVRNLPSTPALPPAPEAPKTPEPKEDTSNTGADSARVIDLPTGKRRKPIPTTDRVPPRPPKSLPRNKIQGKPNKKDRGTEPEESATT